jgi:hypothetical protein
MLEKLRGLRRAREVMLFAELPLLPESGSRRSAEQSLLAPSMTSTPLNGEATEPSTRIDHCQGPVQIFVGRALTRLQRALSESDAAECKLKVERP